MTETRETRKLVSIQEIKGVDPIEGADRIERLTVMGWHCVSEKGNFKPGDKCVYFEVDCKVPADIPEFAFLEPYGYRIKTIKLRGQVSQGLCLPLDVLGIEADTPIGTDVTERLGVIKWMPKAAGYKTSGIIAAHPGYVPRTDELRIQSYMELLDEMRGLPVYYSVKLDGKSGTFSHREGEVWICSRKNAFEEADNDVHWQAARTCDIPANLPKMGNVAIQGEICGPGIQKNKLGLESVGFFCFQVFDIGRHRYYDYKDFVEFCGDWKIPTVPIEDTNVKFDFTLEQLLEMAKGRYPASKRHREGIVFRPMVETYSKVLRGRMSFKVINNDYLIKEDD